MFRAWAFLLLACTIPATAPAQKHSNPPHSGAVPLGDEWHFIVSGDSRNCGDLIMPAIAADAEKYHPLFYWHLGDLRAIYELDEDFVGELNQKRTNVLDLTAYQNAAWNDFIQMQIRPFEQRGIPFLLGIGNHETISPKTRDQFIDAFGRWLDAPLLREQRLADYETARVAGQSSSADISQKVQTYFHWKHQGIDFIYLDNATADQFDHAQMAWLRDRLEADRTDPVIKTVVVGMHKALPDSLSNFHSMSESPVGEQSGRCVYRQLEKLQRESHKQFYVLSSHSHFIMTNIYDTRFWHEHAAGILPGILIGTAGAVRYRLPDNLPRNNQDAATCMREGKAHCAQTDVYGYLLGTVNGKGKAGKIDFEFRKITEKDVPSDIRQKFSADTIRVCFKGNKQLTPSTDSTQDLPDGPCPD